MSEKVQVGQNGGSRPQVFHPGPTLIEDLLSCVDPAPDAETERFVELIYADRQEYKENPSPR
jgi:hypothetical protein